jgi:protein disulfide-isomerase A6
VCILFNLSYSVVKAGRHPELDELASQFLVATAKARDAIVKEAKILTAKAGPLTKHYLRVMEKLANDSEDYLEKEATRCVTC